MNGAVDAVSRLLLAACLALQSCAWLPGQPPPSTTLARTWDAHVGVLTASQAGARWGAPLTMIQDGNWMRTEWPVAGGLVLWFDEPGVLQQWRLLVDTEPLTIGLGRQE